MDERRFRLALDTITETISDFGEDTIFAALGVIAENFGWELLKRDPGPDDGEFWTDEECTDPKCACHRPRLDQERYRRMSDDQLINIAFGLHPSGYRHG